MVLRLLPWLTLLLTGCITPRWVERPATQKPAEASAKFGELITVPGQYVAKNPMPQAPADDAALFPTRVQCVKPTEHIDTLLVPVAAADSPLMLATRDYFEGRTEKAIERIKDLDPANQEMILRLLPALKHAGRADLSGKSPSDAAVLGSQLEAAAEATAKLSPLKIRNACFVWRVEKFGVYEPVPAKHPFLGGSGSLYLELQNAPCQAAKIPAGGDGFVTRLECSYLMLDAEGKSIAPKRTQPHAEYTRSPVRDYFLKIEFEVPKDAGKYTLVVELRDPGNNRSVKHNIDLIVASR